ncbi:hypothetical protein NITMOv2_3023 [Nitrospira moscoviensis]|uniref:Uncharacterized protein n=1 Tax=Nitrospira moscoviensis TaxID=42253 RepID=A0A0K2GEQ0_NITMO|nr:hypothetical protein NITMOv2_3023 [Nitrospira moscoviensis]
MDKMELLAVLRRSPSSWAQAEILKWAGKSATNMITMLSKRTVVTRPWFTDHLQRNIYYQIVTIHI